MSAHGVHLAVTDVLYNKKVSDDFKTADSKTKEDMEYKQGCHHGHFPQMCQF
jgi:hypothetical protein